MSFNGAGAFSIINTFVYDTVISETEVNANFSDIATGLSTCITKDGQTTVTANIPMAGNKFTGLGDGSAAQDATALHQIQDQDGIWCGTAGGTKNALTLSPSPAITAYSAGQKFRFIVGGTPSDDAVTVTISGLTAKDVQINGSALSASVTLESGKIYDLDYDGTQFQATRISSKAVSGPATSTDSAVALYDGTSGTLLKDGPSIGVASGNLPTVSQSVTTTASASTVTLGTTLEHSITGTTTITAFNGVAGVTYHCRADAAFTLTNGTDLVLPTSANITTAAGDTFDVYMVDADTALVRNYQRFSGSPIDTDFVKTELNAAGDAPIYALRSWISFNGVTTVIRGAGNVSSISKPATGRYKINFTTLIEDEDYSATVGLNRDGTVTFCAGGPIVKTTSYVEVCSTGSTGAGVDYVGVDVAVVR